MTDLLNYIIPSEILTELPVELQALCYIFGFVIALVFFVKLAKVLGMFW